MATGYTAAIEKGITFEQFTMDCARAFGALVSMRDAPSDAEIPQELKPSDYDKHELAKSETELAVVKTMRNAQATVKARQDYKASISYLEEAISKAGIRRTKYYAMLAKVEAWIPPSSDHQELKKFMVKQIGISIESDCDTKYYTDQKPTLLSGQQWKEKRIAGLLKDIAYHSEEHTKELDRIASNNTWLKQLRESLK